MSSTPRLNFIGCGRAGRVLGRLWYQAGVFEIGDVLTTSVESASAAVAQIGSGSAVGRLDALRPADVFVLATPDREIRPVGDQLLQSGILRDGDTLVHLSGALSSSETFPAVRAGIGHASAHPLRSFGDFDSSVRDFAGTWCGLEGSRESVQQIDNALQQLGARTFRIDPERKLAYHAGSVMASNYLNALIGAAVESLGHAAIDSTRALAVLTPLFENTIRNIAAEGPLKSLTGPVARGDVETVTRELELLGQLDEDLAMVYREMGRATVRLMPVADETDTDARDKLKKLFDQ